MPVEAPVTSTEAGGGWTMGGESNGRGLRRRDSQAEDSLHPSLPEHAMATRRAFVTSLVGAGVALPAFRPNAIRQARRAADRASSADPQAVAQDEAYWAEIQRAFDSHRTIVNLKKRGGCPPPTH